MTCLLSQTLASSFYRPFLCTWNILTWNETKLSLCFLTYGKWKPLTKIEQIKFQTKTSFYLWKHVCLPIKQSSGYTYHLFRIYCNKRFYGILAISACLEAPKGQSDCSWQHTQHAYISVWLVSLTHHLFSSTSEMWSSLCHLPNLTKIISDCFTPESRGLFSLFFLILLTVEHPSETPCFSRNTPAFLPLF